jgi:hypothetical protein
MAALASGSRSMDPADRRTDGPAPATLALARRSRPRDGDGHHPRAAEALPVGRAALDRLGRVRDGGRRGLHDEGPRRDLVAPWWFTRRSRTRSTRLRGRRSRPFRASRTVRSLSGRCPLRTPAASAGGSEVGGVGRVRRRDPGLDYGAGPRRRRRTWWRSPLGTRSSGGRRPVGQVQRHRDGAVSKRRRIGAGELPALSACGAAETAGNGGNPASGRYRESHG